MITFDALEQRYNVLDEEHDVIMDKIREYETGSDFDYFSSLLKDSSRMHSLIRDVLDKMREISNGSD